VFLNGNFVSGNMEEIKLAAADAIKILAVSGYPGEIIEEAPYLAGIF